MASDHVRWLALAGKERALALLLGFLSVSLLPATASSETRPIEFLLDQPPVSLNPRSTLDATGQRLNNLLYSGLTRIAPNLDVLPELAESWRIFDSGREIHFKIRSGLKDHSGKPISAEDLSACLEQYRNGKPSSPYKSSFPSWKGTRHEAREVILDLNKPDPYIFRNLSLLHYFRTKSNPVPCSEPEPNEEIIGSGPYRAAEWNPLPDTELKLVPIVPSRYLPVHFQFVVDDNTRVLKLLRNDVDATIDSLGIAKQRWIQKHYGDRFKLVERRSTRVSYLAMNERTPILAKPEVRRSIALAIDRNRIVQHKMFGLASVAGSLLAPEIPEAVEIPFPYDPKLAERILDQAGFPRKGREQIRFELRYKTTPVREGFETALMIREMLQQVGIRVVLDLVEPAVFLQSVRKGNFELASSRWLGISDGSILYRTLDSKSPDNRVSYVNPEVDKLLERASSELDPKKRALLLREVQKTMARDLPYFPLWFWHVGVIVRKDHPVLSKIRPEDLSVSGALEPILLLR